MPVENADPLPSLMFRKEIKLRKIAQFTDEKVTEYVTKWSGQQ